ncbi:MAG: cation:proton antiporter [Planctomycetes bacterium]|nr:cation:proton antiporter [Planctomycetota bacterium]
MHERLLTDIGLCIVAATVLAFAARILRQPLILAYIGAGILIGPIGLRWIHDDGSVADISRIGLAFLLFIVGLEMDVKKLLESARVAGVVTVVQVAGCAAIGYGAAWALGYHGYAAAYVAVAIAFSSTMIVIKLLSDKAELDTVAGRITLGVLLFQDVLAIVVLAVQSNIASPSFLEIGLSLARGLGLALGSVLAARYVLPHLFRLVAKMPEIMLIASITWCFLIAYLAVRAGFSEAMGALIAGVSISTMPYSLDVVAKIRTLRDFFVTLFFVALGMQIQVPGRAMLVAAGVLTAATILSRFVTVMPPMRALRYGARMGALTSISLAQVSEFSLVIVALGLQLGHIDKGVVSLVAIVLVTTCTLSTYMIRANQQIAGGIARLFGRAGMKDPQAAETRREQRGAPILLVGCHRTGASLVDRLREMGSTFEVIDFSPEVHRKLGARGIECAYGDVSHKDTLEHAGVREAKILVCTIPEDFLRGIDNRRLLRMLRELNPEAKILMTTDRLATARELYELGADYVILPRWLSAERLAQVIKDAEAGTIETLREAEMRKLAEADEVVP